MKQFFMIVCILGLLLVLGGCNRTAKKDWSTRIAVAQTMTTPTGTEGQMHNRMTRTAILNGRQINDDLMRFFLLDRPSRMSMAPIQ
jgi:uncharacterized membrane protein